VGANGAETTKESVQHEFGSHTKEVHIFFRLELILKQEDLKSRRGVEVRHMEYEKWLVSLYC
jgi:hypothetical protein